MFNYNSKFSSLFLLLLTTLVISGCGLYKPVDVRKNPINVDDRVKKNIQEGRGYKLFDSNRNKGPGVFEFASSNPMWRASVKLLDFTPFSNVDYSGGIIITDWFSNDEISSNESIKITVRFLSNEIRSDGLSVIIHKRSCNTTNNCNVSKVESELSNEIKLAILKEASILKELDDRKLVNPDFKMPGEGNDNAF